MRTLTEAEGRVIAVLLGGAGTSERERLKRAGVPRSTYHAARKRAYEEGWLKDRYVPDPARLERPIATFGVVRPYVDHLDELVAAWSGRAENLLTWASPQFVVGIFVHPTVGAAQKATAELIPAGWSRWQSVLHVDLHGPSVPVYFDYEGLWSHLAGLSGTATYPNGLGGHADGEAASMTSHQRWAARELVFRPFAAQASGRAGHLVGPLGLPFSQQKMMRAGWVVHRVLLDPARVPPYRGRAADQVTFVLGELRAEARPEQLFTILTRECRVFPFLFVTDGGRLLMGALGRTPGGPAPAEATEPRRPVMATLQSYLQGIEILSEAASAFRPVVDHRYDRLFPEQSVG